MNSNIMLTSLAACLWMDGPLNAEAKRSI